MVKPKKESDEELQALCSACFTGVPVARAHVVPHYNDMLLGYVTAYRCENCWLKTLDETRDRLAACTDPEEVATAAAFFERYKVRVMEYRRGDPLPVLKAKLLDLIAELRSGKRKLDFGKPIPLNLPDDFFGKPSPK